MVAPVCAQAEKADGTVGEAQDGLPTIRQPACGTGDCRDQSDSTRMGELLCGRALEPVLFVYQPMGGAEDSAAPDARPRTPGVRVEAVE